MGTLSLIISFRIFNNREKNYLNRIARSIETDLGQFYQENPTPNPVLSKERMKIPIRKI